MSVARWKRKGKSKKELKMYSDLDVIRRRYEKSKRDEGNNTSEILSNMMGD